MSFANHLIIGGGVIGRQAALALLALGQHATLASRTPPAKAMAGIPHLRLDALDGAAVRAAAHGFSHLYLTLGLPYRAAVWEHDWPRVMRHAIDAALVHGARLVWFDNLYAYGPLPLQVPMREDHSIEPVSRKGRVRALLLQMLREAGESRGLRWLVARSADFYGPGATLSMLYATGIQRQLHGRVAWWPGNPDLRHSFTHVGDAARALALLALQADTWGQSWHLPTAEPAPTPRSLLTHSARLLGAPPAVRPMPRAVMQLLGLVVPIVRDLAEMRYQYEQDYVFDSSRFMAHFPDFRVTPYIEGMSAMVESFRLTDGA